MGFGRLCPFPMRLGSAMPLAAQLLAAIKGSMGDAFTQENHSLVGAENIALARLLTGLQWQSEKLQNNSLPGTSYEMLYAWADRLGISFRPTDSIASIRAACEAKYLASAGATQSNVNDSLSLLLGGSFIDVTYFYGDLSTVPEQTYWPNNPDPLNAADLGLGDGTWSSPRAHILVSVQQASGQSFNDLMYLVNVRMYNLLDTLLPAWATFDFNVGEYSTGFIIGESLIGYSAL